MLARTREVRKYVRSRMIVVVDRCQPKQRPRIEVGLGRRNLRGHAWYPRHKQICDAERRRPVRQLLSEYGRQNRPRNPEQFLPLRYRRQDRLQGWSSASEVVLDPYQRI